MRLLFNSQLNLQKEEEISFSLENSNISTEA